MNPAEEKLYEIVAQEIAAKQMKPGLYTKAFSDAGGDKDRALAIYIRLRVEDIIQTEIVAVRAAAAQALKAEQEAASLNAKDPQCKCGHRSSQHSSKGFWRYPCFQCACKDFYRVT